MKRIALLISLVCAASPTHSQNLAADLSEFVRTPGVTGYEHILAEKIRERLAPWKPQTDNMGNVWVTLGSGAPHKLIVAPMDEPGYIVSAITPDGYLRVQRLPPQTPHGLFDQLHSAQAVQIHTRSGKYVTGIVAGLSTHLQGARRDAPRVNHPDEMYIDIGASSAAEAKQAGVDLLDPIAIERQLLVMGADKLTAASIGDRFGPAALIEMLRRLQSTNFRGTFTGTLTVALVAQQWATSRGLDRLLQHIKPDEMIYVGRTLPQRSQGAARPEASAQPRAPRPQPGVGVLITTPDGAAPTGLPLELGKLAGDGIANVVAASAPLPRVTFTRGPVPPDRFAHLSIATAWPATPAEFIDWKDLVSLIDLLQNYVSPAQQGAPPALPANPAFTVPVRTTRLITAPSNKEILRQLVEAYGVSGYEQPVHGVIESLLPAWAKPETDDKGNLILRVAARRQNSKAPRITFVAHSDELGYVIESIAADGRLVVRSRGGGTIYFFAGHPMLVHAAAGIRPGVMELPANWDAPDFEWPRGGPQAPGGESQLRVDVGARRQAQVAQLGIKVGDSLTIPKKYRPLFGTRANGRAFDDRLGSTALVAAAWALGPSLLDRDVTFVWAVEEEIGLRGALVAADNSAKKGETPDFVFAVDTFVSSDSPLESPRYANAPIGKGFVIRAVDNSNITDRKHVDKLISLARANQIPVQYGTTSGGNDGAAYLRHGAIDIPIAWPLRYSHSPGEVIDLRDADALARIVAVISRSW